MKISKNELHYLTRISLVLILTVYFLISEFSWLNLLLCTLLMLLGLFVLWILYDEEKFVRKLKNNKEIDNSSPGGFATLSNSNNKRRNKNGKNTFGIMNDD